MAKSTISIKSRVLRGTALGCLAAILQMAPTAAFAAQGDEAASTTGGGLAEIVVTAQRRAESLQDVPIAVNAITSDTLKNAGIADTADLVRAVPSLNFTRSGPSGIFIIRGVSTPNGAAGEEGSTAVYVDDVYMADLASTINKFNNIERIEVLNGPQGTLFGRNAVGGLVRIITRDPGLDTEFKGQVGVGNYDIFSGQAYFSTPITDNVGWNIAFTGQDQGKGLGYNPTLGKRVRTDDYWGLRSKLVAEPTDRLKVTLTGDYFKTDNDYAVYVHSTTPDEPVSQDSTSGYPSSTRIKVWSVGANIELDLDFATLTSITSYRKLTNKSAFDVDGKAPDIFHLYYDSGSKSFQQEVRLSSNTTDPLSWQVGAFYLHRNSFTDQVQGGLFVPAATTIPTARTIEISATGKTDSIAFFGEVTYAITPTTHLTGGVRWTQDKAKLPVGYQDIVDADGNILVHLTNPIDSAKFDEFTYRVALRQDITDDVNVYASVNRGFKSGQFNLQSPQHAPVDPQTIMAYEAGLKGEFLDRRLRVNLAGFHYDIDDYQIRSSRGGPSLLQNAAKVKIDGVDINAEAVITDQFLLTAGASYLDSRFDVFGGPKGGGVIAPVPGGDASGNRTAIAPKFTFSTSGTYTIPFDDGSELRLTGGYVHKSKYYFEADNVLHQPAYDLFNGSVEYRVNENFAFELWMKNISNEKYNVQAATAVGTYTLAGEPRTYGLNAKITY